MERDANVLPFKLSQARRQDLFLEAAELHERRQQILRLLGMVAVEDSEGF